MFPVQFFIAALLMIATLFQPGSAAAQHTTTKVNTYAYVLHIPASMHVVSDTAINGVHIYYDSTNDILLAVSISKSMFKSVDDYLNCSWPDLDKNLKKISEDSSFHLISCIKNKKATILSYTVDARVNNYPYCILYFIHRDAVELQFSFFSKSTQQDNNEKYAADIMRTMRVRRLKSY